jgi:hypothetical protein
MARYCETLGSESFREGRMTLRRLIGFFALVGGVGLWDPQPFSGFLDASEGLKIDGDILDFG